MSAKDPQVRDTECVIDQPDGPAQRLVVGSPAWFVWLADTANQRFSFDDRFGNFLARKERKQRGGWYWVAYRRANGKLYKAYLGKPEDVTLERLRDAAARLAARERQPQPASPRAPNPVHLLATKLFAPITRPHMVARPRLIERLQQGLAGRLTLVSAPAGFGKSTLVAEWLQSVERGAQSVERDSASMPGHTPAQTLQVAWVSLDTGDNDPTRFWSYVVAALDTLQPGVAGDILVSLQSSQPPPITIALTSLLNALSQLPAQAVLVLDDYHTISAPAIHQAMAFVIEHLPPQLHVVLTTRSDPPLPLTRLRARDELNELRSNELRFTAGETAQFLTGPMALALSHDDIAALDERTEGWIAGLQLAALAMRQRSDLSQFVAAFTGSNRFVLDYLAAEVLDQLPARLHRFILQTAILERMCAPLCDAVLEVRDWRLGDGENGPSPIPQSRTPIPQAYSQLALEQLERANLFIVPLDDVRGWYRYHHLFAEVARGRLRSELDAATIAALHTRASRWYSSQGLVAEAIQHALAAHDWDQVASLIEEHGLKRAISGEASTVLGWIAALPDALIRARPILCIYHAIVLLFTNQPDASAQRLQDAERCIGPDTPEDQARAIAGQVALMRANLARSIGDLAGCMALSRQALSLLPDTVHVARSGAALNMARAYQDTGDVTPAAERLAAESIASSRAVGNLIATLNGLTNLARLHVLQGRLRAADAAYQEAAQVAPGLSGLLGTPAYYFGMGELLCERNQLDAAEEYLTQGMGLMHGVMIVDADAVALGYTALVRLRQARGATAEALAALDEFAQLSGRRRFAAPLVAYGAALRAGVLLAQGDSVSAAAWAETVIAGDTPAYIREFEYLTLARVKIAQSRKLRSAERRLGDVRRSDPFGDALRILAKLLPLAEAGARMHSAIKIRILQALALHARGEQDHALDTLAPALLLAAPEGFVRVFVDEGAAMAALLRLAGAQGIAPGYVERLLLALPEAQSVERRAQNEGTADLRSTLERSHALVEPLTERELEVLRLIADGASNQAIADRLSIAVGTVKRHINNLFGKLGVQSRTQAIRAAQEQGLI
jgi:LuxR family maltose regulon positive regulatory protein